MTILLAVALLLASFVMIASAAKNQTVAEYIQSVLGTK